MIKKWMMLLLCTMVVFSSGAISFALTEGDFAGSGVFSFKDGEVFTSDFRFPQGMLAGKNDVLYVADTYNNVIRYIGTGKVQTLNAFSTELDASGFPFGGHVDGTLKSAMFNRPKDLVMDSKGNIFVADSRNNCIRKISGQKVYTFSGKGKPGYADGLPQNAMFNNPSGIAIDDQDNLYVADSFNNAIRKITPKGEVSTLAGNGPAKVGYVDGLERKAQFNEPQDIVYDKVDKSLYVADTGNGLIRKIMGGKVTTVAGAFTGMDKSTQYAVGGYKDGFSSKAQFNFPKSLAIPESGTLLIADTGNHCVRVVKEGRVDTLKTTSAVTFIQPVAFLCDQSQGRLFVADDGDNKIKLLPLNLAQYGLKVPSFVLNGKAYIFKSAKPFVDGTQVMVPLKETVVALKGQVVWDTKKNAIAVTVNEKTVLFGEAEGVLIEAGVGYVDLKNLATKLGMKGSYDAQANKAGLEK